MFEPAPDATQSSLRVGIIIGAACLVVGAFVTAVLMWRRKKQGQTKGIINVAYGTVVDGDGFAQQAAVIARNLHGIAKESWEDPNTYAMVELGDNIGGDTCAMCEQGVAEACEKHQRFMIDS